MQNNFEKQVQQKMDELRFEPTPPVWQKVALQIQTEKKRRQLFIWLPLLALLLAGGIGWLWQARNSSDGVAINGNQSAGVQQSKNAETNEPSQKIKQLPSKTNATTQKINVPVIQLKKPDQKANQQKENGQIHHQPSVTNTSSSVKKIIATQQKKIEEVGVNKKQVPNNAPPQTIAIISEKSADQKSNISASSIEMESKKTNPVSSGNIPSTKIMLVPRSLSEGGDQNPLEPTIKKPVAKETLATQKIVSSTQPDTTKTAAPSTLIVDQPIKSKWQIQLNAAAGISNLSSGINVFNGQKSMADATAFASPQPVTSSRRAPSTISSGFSFSMGAAAGKPLSKRLSFSVGLQYNYYSTNIAVGQLTRQDSVLSNAVRVERFYANSGSNFSNQTNNYHFLSLPVLLHWQINKKIPLYFNTGFSMQQMVASNALLYDAGSNIYYTDNSAFNKTQLFTHASISYRMVNNKKFSIQLGPQLQYGFSQLEKNKTGNHLFAATVNAQIIFAGKKESH